MFTNYILDTWLPTLAHSAGDSRILRSGKYIFVRGDPYKI